VGSDSGAIDVLLAAAAALNLLGQSQTGVTHQDGIQPILNNDGHVHGCDPPLLIASAFPSVPTSTPSFLSVMARVLNVAEKPSVASAIASILGEGRAKKSQGQSPFNPIFEFPCHLPGVGRVTMVVTSVAGHLLENEFEGKYKGWSNVDPSALFFDAPVTRLVPTKFDKLVRQLEHLSRQCSYLILWLDCDREGESIGFEVKDVCSRVNQRMQVRRAHFSAITPHDIRRALTTLSDPNPHLNAAVELRQEIDLRIGSAFTRLQTLRLQRHFPGSDQFKLVSYGPCQFPTLGFVVNRYRKRQAFRQEKFWKIEIEHKKDDTVARFEWSQHRLFDQLECSIIFEDVVEAGECVITEVTNRETRKSRPVPLSTVEMQKALSRPPYRLSSHRSMDVAEKLYQAGYISYPRTETDSFKEGSNLQELIKIQTGDARWGDYAQRLLDGAFQYPRNGGHDDGAHPPIHPTQLPHGLDREQSQVYEFIARHFLACCSQDALGHQTVAHARIANEQFTARGLMITARNYLDVYIYDRWQDKTMPHYQPQQRFVPTEIMMTEGKTVPPPLLSESDLIALMDKNGIGTDATIAQHIKTIQDRGYAVCSNHVFTPTELGLGLVEGYDELKLQMSDPTLRAHMEREMSLVSQGLKNKDVVLREILVEMKRVYDEVERNIATLEQHVIARFTPEQRAAHQSAIQASATLLADAFSRCGQCGNMCELQESQGSGQPYPTRFLHCAVCQFNLKVPSHTLHPHSHTCPICNFQVLTVNNEQRNTTYNLCPYCFNHPPAQYSDIEDGGGSFGGFRCFSCKHPDCALSNKTRGNLSSDPVRVCPCGGMMTLKQFPNGAYYLGCTNYPQCTTKIMVTCKDAQVAPRQCSTCVSTSGFRARFLTLTFSSGQAPPHIDNPFTACVGGCDEDMNTFIDLRRGAPSTSTRPPPAAPSNSFSNRRASASSSSSTSSLPPPSVSPLPSSTRPHFYRDPVSRAIPAGFVNADTVPSTGMNFDPGPQRKRKTSSSASSSSTSASGKKSRAVSTKSKSGARGNRTGTARGRSSSASAAATVRRMNDMADAQESAQFSDFTSSYRAQQQQLARGGSSSWGGGLSSSPSPSPPSLFHSRSTTSANSNALPNWHWRANAPSPSSASASSSSSSAPTCFRCNQPGHYANACPQSTSAPNGRHAVSGRSRTGASSTSAVPDRDTCFRCGQRGHWTSNCPNK